MATAPKYWQAIEGSTVVRVWTMGFWEFLECANGKAYWRHIRTGLILDSARNQGKGE